MKSDKLPIRTALACSNLWKIDKAEKELLDRFFILWDSGDQLFKDLEHRDNPRYPFESDYFLRLERDSNLWNVRFLKQISYLKTLGEQQIGLSFREHKLSHFHWVVITEWKEREKELIKEINGVLDG